ncbi:MAG: hypothetical protein QME48_04610 [bacterium]|uniref:Outer membrane protein beta-barrel domain-containing protein n=1 Tax=candidate division TA06 bacterium 34_109 TaxID=1635277 RepID=A0A117M6M6_UNCT6|nr:MAG: hypothetical protein XD76_1079 [candidate division TA06 bacterium 32_111]KUK87247.1 MAG: hypothetical protein XE03_0855 [candidate division TA06 bacterium 34_109]MDI6700495.1 hypothetical protein [bacterium]HCP16170.1 hypothetical protein [candidate division WOR-3 bacterium]
MKKIFVIFVMLLTILLSSCTAVSLEPYRSADTLGPLHLRVGGGFVGGFSSYANLSNDTLLDLGVFVPMASVFAGIGITNNIDVYGSASFSLITNPVYGASVKYKFFDRFGLKIAIVPTFKYNSNNNNDLGKYSTYGGELPFVLTYSFLNFLYLTGGIHTGYYKVSVYESVNTSYDFLSYGFFIMPEVKFFNLRFSLGCDLRYYESLKYKLIYSDDLNYFQKHINPFLTISFQF